MPTALLIEDNASNRHLATFLLEKAGFTVAHATNGQQGLDLARTQLPDIIVLDIEMPVMDGYETLEHLKASAQTRDIPVLVASSYAMPGERQRALDLGVREYLEKPFDPDDFMQRAQALLSS
ncbi:response regulator [Actomonas aquatica]|uniref:Response regulator n=1 Tax=Actomonas aquatica TaxID=2866162 RepID=A0ABZ1C956_9BACT|nr:response regulator [Opitutus sp. WL0086]WRQ87114.1 response regulator [Opitutus sp. WL0086]